MRCFCLRDPLLIGVLAIASARIVEAGIVTAHSEFDATSGTSLVVVHAGPHSTPADVIESPDPQSLFGGSSRMEGAGEGRAARAGCAPNRLAASRRWAATRSTCSTIS